MKALGITLALLLIALTVRAGEEALTRQPAYVDFAGLSADYGEPRVMINLGATLLKLASALPHDDPAAAETLRNLDAVRVHVYDTVGDTGAARAQMDAVSDELASRSWEQIVRVREQEEQVDVYLMYDAERIHGLMLMAVDEEEAVFVNVLGDIDPQKISEVMEHIDMDLDVDLDI